MGESWFDRLMTEYPNREPGSNLASTFGDVFAVLMKIVIVVSLLSLLFAGVLARLFL